MPSELPPGFSSLETVISDENVARHVIGVVTDVLPPKKTVGGTDFMLTFSISDPTTYNNLGQKIRFFSKQEQTLPKIERPGDMIILRNIKNKPWSGAPILVSNFQTSWAVILSSQLEGKNLDVASINHIKINGAPEPKAVEIEYAISIAGVQDKSVFTVLPTPETRPNVYTPKQKFSLVADIGADQFYDLVGQVVKLWQDFDRVNIYVTDYTSNPVLYNYQERKRTEDEGRDGDQYNYANKQQGKWTGPYGQRTLAVTLFSPHSYWAQNHVKINDFVLLKNVHVRLARQGSAKLEGVIHTETKHPDTVLISRVDFRNDQRAKDILKRKHEYMEEFGVDRNGSGEETMKRKATAKATKAAKKKSRDKGKTQNLPKEKNEAISDGVAQAEEHAISNPKSGPQELTVAAIHAARNALNQHIRVRNPEQPSRSVASILSTETHTYRTKDGNECTLPFQNYCSRTTVRVLDFKPDNLEDFSVRRRVSELDALSDDDDADKQSSTQDLSGSTAVSLDGDDDPDRPSQYRWEWRFKLLVEDATSKDRERVVLKVAQEDGEYLLNLTASDLRADKAALGAVREKLFILWGDLEEVKSKALATSLGPSTQKLLDPNCEQSSRESATSAAGAQLDKGEDERVRSDETPKTWMDLVSDTTKPAFTKPFSCNVKEYGVKYGEMWERSFRMFGTTISG